MEAHARSLLERLNTASSPKPLSKSATPEPKSLASPFTVDTRKDSSPNPSISSVNLNADRDVLDGPEATMSVKDLLVSARHRSREQSVEAHASLADNSEANDARHTDAEARHSETPPIAPVDKESQPAVINTSDGDSSANHEDLPTTPSGSNNSSIASISANISQTVTVNKSSPQGFRIVNDVPSIVTLPHVKSEIPRLQFNSDSSGRLFPGDGIEQIANLARSFGLYDRDVIGATTKYIVYALKDGRIRIIDQNTGTRAIAETPSTAPVISLFIQDGHDSEESFLLVLDTSHDLTIWSIKPWKIDSADVPLDYSIRIRTTGRKVDQSFPPIAKWWPRYSNCLAVCTGLAVCIYVFPDTQSGLTININKDNDHAISIPVETGVRDFSFSADGSALAVVDYHGDILLWALCSDATFSEFYETSRLKSKLGLSKPTIKYALPTELNPCSVQFLEMGDGNNGAHSTPLLLVGSSYNRHLHLIDIGRGVLLQEIVLPSIDAESMPAQNFSMSYTKERGFLTVGDTISNSIFFFHLHTPTLKSDAEDSQSDYLANIADTNWRDSQFSDGILPAFDYVTVVPFFPHHRLQSLAVTSSMDAALDVFTAHSNGFTMLSPDHEDILPANHMEAKIASTKSISDPQLARELDVAARSTGTRSPSPKAHSGRSSTESVRSIRGTKQISPKKDSAESLRGRSPAAKVQPKVNETADTKSGSSDVTTEYNSPIRDTSDKPRSPSFTSQAQPPPETQIEQAPIGFQDILNQALEQQYQRFAAEQRHLTLAADDRHESILKVVSSTLTTNVGKLLEQTVRLSIEKSILPIVTSIVKKSVDEQLATVLTPLEKTMTKEVRAAVTNGLTKTLNPNDNGKLIDKICETVAGRLELSVQRELSARLETLFEKNIPPLISKVEQGMKASMQQTQKDNIRFQAETTKKLDALTEAIAGLADQLKVNKSEPAVQEDSPARAITPPVDRTKLEMNQCFKVGKYSSGIEIWSDSLDAEQASLFDVCLDYDPSILKGLEQLSLMSAMNAISIDFRTHLEMRLVWLEKIITLVRREGRYTEYWPRVLKLLDQRLEATYGEMTSKNHKPSLARKVAVTQYYTQEKLNKLKQ